MQTSEARALVTEIQDRLIDLYVQQDEARREHDPDQARELQVEIDKATAQREEIRRRGALDRRKQQFGRIANGNTTRTRAKTARARESVSVAATPPCDQ